MFQVSHGEELLHRLGCDDSSVKVVSIFGNTGDGKSYTLNHVFFGGEEVSYCCLSQNLLLGCKEM